LILTALGALIPAPLAHSFAFIVGGKSPSRSPPTA